MTTRSLASITVAAVLMVLALTGCAVARDRIVFLAADYPEAWRERIDREMSEIVAALKRGDRLVVQRASDHKQIADIIVPDRSIYDHSRKLLPLLQQGMKQISDYLSEAVAAPEPAGVRSQLGLPTSLDAVRYRAGGTVDVMYIGSPLYDEPKSQPFSMRLAYPSLGHLSLSRTETPFGLAERKEAFKNANVHICSTEQGYIRDAHRIAVERFWTAYVAGAGGRLLTVSDDLALCRERFLAASTDGALQAPTARAEDAQAAMISVDVALAAPTPVAAVPPDLGPRLGLSSADAAPIMSAVSSGKATVFEADVYDFQEEDGDVVGVRVVGLTIPILLRHQPVRVPLLMADGKLTLVGVKDGKGGGITVGVRLPNGGEPRLIRLVPGEVLEVPIR
jgi:hypothetical protein